MKALRRRYPSMYSSVGKARREVSSFARGCGFAPSDISDIALAVGEACNNAAEHGHVAHGQFTVVCSCDDERLIIEVCDEGCGFNPSGKGQSVEPERLGGRGLGIFIMRSLMDDLCYSQTRRGTSVRLTKVLRGAPSAHAVDGRPHAALDLSAVYDRAKALFKFSRVQPDDRRER